MRNENYGNGAGSGSGCLNKLFRGAAISIGVIVGLFIIVVIVAVAVEPSSNDGSTATPTREPTLTPTPALPITPSAVLTAPPTPSLTQTSTPIPTREPTLTPTPALPITPSAVLTAPPTPTGEPTLTPTAAAEPSGNSAAEEYVVQAGDTLRTIAEQFGTTIDSLVEANEIDNADLIRTGQVLLIPPSTTTAGIRERAVLVALYNATGGPHWKDNRNWLSDAPIGQWRGVTTVDRGRVTRLDLRDNQLDGEIPPELGRLTNLTELDLGRNQLGGEIPPELGRLTNLTELDLGRNQLGGEIPPELGNLTNLTGLGLYMNQLGGEIPSDLGRLTNLTWLSLVGNQLRGEIPSELGNLAKLTQLYLQENQLRGCIPERLRDVFHNDFSGLGLPFCGTESPTPTVASDLTPTPTATPALIKMALTDLLDEYDQNKVRANTLLRYQQNGKRPVSTSGYISRIEELYSVVTPAQERYSPLELYCYYADTKAALHLTKGQFVSIAGRIRGMDEYSSVVHMIECEFEGIQLESYPKVSIVSLRENVVQVFCVQEASLFGVVTLSSENKGTGVIIDAENGVILTVHHVVADENDCTKIEVELSGSTSRITATTLKHCASIDRARLRIFPGALASQSFQPIYRASAPAQIDQEVYFLGYGPGRLRMETGVVKKIWGKDIVTDAYAVPGDSGSPVFDENGHLLGTISSGNRSDRTVFTGDEC